MNRILVVILVLAVPITSVCASEQGEVKGNISSKGNKTYHIPGCPQYQDVKINRPGERLFRTEKEATAAGWKKASNCPGFSSTASTSRSSCSTAGLADSYVLALSWQPAFCEANRGKDGCSATSSSAWQATNFTLHGLWPNRNSCGTKYDFCGSVKKPIRKYPFIPISDVVKPHLMQVMPSYAEGGDLHLYEWYKHGTCQARSIDEYFRVSISLTRDFNTPEVANFMASNTGKEVSTKEFLRVVDYALGANASKRILLKCKSRNLVEVRINLPKDLGNSHLDDLLPYAKESQSGNCGRSFQIDSISN